MAEVSDFEKRLDELLENIRVVTGMIEQANDSAAVPKKGASKMLLEALELVKGIQGDLDELRSREKKAREALDRDQKGKAQHFSSTLVEKIRNENLKMRKKYSKWEQKERRLNLVIDRLNKKIKQQQEKLGKLENKLASILRSKAHHT